MHHSLSLLVTDSSQVGAARRTATALASSLGFTEPRQGELALIATEITNNLIKHAGHGEVLLRVLEVDGVAGVEILALDKGPGMASVSRCMEDGYSTAGTPGNGLGAIARLAHEFEVYSAPGDGTVLLARLWARAGGMGTRQASEYGVVHRPKPGQEVCGDSWAVESFPGRSLYLLADGLGHGPEAATASREAVRVFRKHVARRPGEILEAIHGALSGTRGAAVAVAQIDGERREVCYAAVGNIAGAIACPAQTKGMISHNGIVGHQMRKVQEFLYPWSDDALLVLHSDGLSTHGKLERYPGIFVRDAALIAGIMYRDSQRLTDDATILVARAARPEASDPT